MRLSDQSANTLAWLAVFLLAPGVLIMSPTGRVFFLALAAVVALVPVIFGSKKRRIFGGIVIAICLLVGVPTYSEHRKIYDSSPERSLRAPQAEPKGASPGDSSPAVPVKQ